MDVTRKEEIINYSFLTWELFNGSKTPFDETYWRTLITKHFDRIQNHLAQYNHGKACVSSPEDRTAKLAQVKTPTLIIHGAEDPVLPVEHGKALANAIPNSRLKIIEKMRHALNPPFHKEMIELITNHANDNLVE